MKIGDMVRNIRHPQAGLGIVIMIFGHAYAVAVFPNHGKQIIYPDEAEVLSESR